MWDRRSYHEPLLPKDGDGITCGESQEGLVTWFWPNPDELNDFPDPVAFDAGWHGWPAEMANGPSVASEIFAREYIQNAWGSIQQQRLDLEKIGRQDLLPDVAEIQFRFVRLEGEALKVFLAESGLGDLRQRFLRMDGKDRDKQRLALSEFLKEDIEPEHLTVLVCSEFGGLGMYGHWYTYGEASRSGSRLKYALITSRGEQGDLVEIGKAGGSWGHGKKAIASGSKCRVLLVSTAFVPRSDAEQDDPSADRRFVGVAYWKAHVIGDKTFAGLGLLGTMMDSSKQEWMNFRPLHGDEVDELVGRIGCPGFEPRNPGIQGGSGTSYLVVEPSFDAGELAWAINRNWWPMLKSRNDELKVSVITENGLEINVQQDDSALTPFVRCYDFIKGGAKPEKTVEQGPVAGKFLFEHQGKERVFGKVEAGKLSFTSDLGSDGWSWREDGENANVVCLIRGEMVIAYQRFPLKGATRPPYVRGTFLVDPTKRVNDVAARILRLTEPHLHDEWRTKPDNAVAPEDAAFAQSVMNAITTSVREFKKGLLKKREVRTKNFPEFSKLFKVPGPGGKPKKKRKRPRPPASRYFSIQQVSVVRIPDPADPSMLSAEATFEITLLPTNSRLAIPDWMDVEIMLGWRTFEDSQAKNAPELCDHSKDKPAINFTVVGEVMCGRLERGKKATFTWTSRPYPNDWTIAPDPSVSPSSK